MTKTLTPEKVAQKLAVAEKALNELKAMDMDFEETQKLARKYVELRELLVGRKTELISALAKLVMLNKHPYEFNIGNRKYSVGIYVSVYMFDGLNTGAWQKSYSYWEFAVAQDVPFFELCSCLMKEIETFMDTADKAAKSEPAQLEKLREELAALAKR